MQPAEGDDLNHSEDLQREIENLRERLSRLSRASLRIVGDLDPDTVLQETVDGAGQVESLLASRLTASEFR